MEPYEQKTPGDQGNGIMRTEAGAPSPIWLEQAAAEELAGVCMEILGNARNELYLSMRFLDVALSSLYFAPDPSVRGLGTDGTTLFFQMESLAAMYKKNRILVNRTLPPRSGSTVCSAICGTGKSGTGSTGTWPVTLRRSR